MDLAQQCELGQQQLMQMQYIQAEKTLAAAEEIAWTSRDFDSLSRLYMPLQEARRQRRQRCGEGIIRLDLLARSAADSIFPQQIVEKFPQGQLLVAGFASIGPAIEIRQLQSDRSLYVETFLAASYLIDSSLFIAIVPLDDAKMPAAAKSPEDLARNLPANSIVLAQREIPAPSYGNVMAIWERLHSPFLAAADALADPIQRIEGYRKTLRVDYACELAHQRLSGIARELCKNGRKQ